MTGVAIATASDGLFEVLRSYLLAADFPGLTDAEIEPTPLRTTAAARDWLDGPGRRLLVLHVELPSVDALPEWIGRGEAVQRLQEDLAGTVADRVPRLIVTPEPGAFREIDATCRRDRRSLALPMKQLLKHRQALLRPFLAMLLGEPDETGAVPGTFRVIEVQFENCMSRCYVGFGEGALLEWDASQSVHPLRNAALVFEDETVYKNLRWALTARDHGERLFTQHVIEALGSGLYGHIEWAAGGLQGLAFRYAIKDETLYLAPFEASVRLLTEKDSPFVLLRAPLARRLLPQGVIRAPTVASSRMPPLMKVLFVRSQMGEHPDGRTTGDNYTLLIPGAGGVWKERSALFAPLRNVDVELAALRRLAGERPDRLSLDVVDLSDPAQCAPGAGVDYVKNRLNASSYDIVHYAGHAWSDGDGTAHLILPGIRRGEATGLLLSEFAAFEGTSPLRLVYLSACRGISKGTVQSLAHYGIPHGIGFRYQVEDDKAARFAEAFYAALCTQSYVPVAFRAACAAARDALRTEDESPIWLSPILLAQTADWAMRA